MADVSDKNYAQKTTRIAAKKSFCDLLITEVVL
jgi:hypothetical protein